MRGQSLALRLHVKQAYTGYASVCNVKPFANLVEATITRASGGTSFPST
jgi:hypothetical protein